MWLVLCLACILISLAVHSAACRIQLPLNFVFRFVAVGTALGLVLSGALLNVYGPSLETLAALLLYALACELYIFLFTFISTSVAASLLMRLRDGELSIEQIDRLYSETQMVDGRLTKLVANGYIQAHSGRVFLITARGARLVRIFDQLRRWFRHSPRTEYGVNLLEPTRDNSYL